MYKSTRSQRKRYFSIILMYCCTARFPNYYFRMQLLAFLSISIFVYVGWNNSNSFPSPPKVCGALVHIDKIILFFRDSVRSFFLSRPQYAITGTGILGQIAPASGGGSNAPRPAVSVPHLDVNADGCRARQARSCKYIACRAGIPEILFVS